MDLCKSYTITWIASVVAFIVLLPFLRFRKSWNLSTQGGITITFDARNSDSFVIRKLNKFTEFYKTCQISLEHIILQRNLNQSDCVLLDAHVGSYLIEERSEKLEPWMLNNAPTKLYPIGATGTEGLSSFAMSPEHPNFEKQVRYEEERNMKFYENTAWTDFKSAPNLSSSLNTGLPDGNTGSTTSTAAFEAESTVGDDC